MKRKEKKEEYTGLFHNADDYGIYHMTAQQRILGFVVGMIAGAVVFQIFFGLWIFSIIAAAGCGIVGILAYKNILHKKRNALLLLEFRDMLESISTSLGSGKNTTQAFSDARSDMKNQYGEALKNHQDNPMIYQDYTITLAKLGQFERAQEMLDAGNKLGLPKDSFQLAQGELLSASGDKTGAEKCFETAIASASSDQVLRRAVMLAAENDKAMGTQGLEKEIELLEQYKDHFDTGFNIVLKETLADAYMRLAEATKDNSQYEKAVGLFREIADSGFMTFRLYENMAILYENMQDFEEAEHVLEKMVSDYPNSYVPYKRLAFLEADIQQNKASKDRDYSKMKEYYELCRKLYDNSEDTEMQVLEKLMDDVINGGW